MLKRLLKEFKYGKKGFTLIELLVVVAILGVLAAVAIPNVAKFINSGKDQAWDTELANIQTSVTALMAAASTGTLTATGDAAGTADMSTITATKTVNGSSTVLYLDDYISASAMSSAGVLTSGHKYIFTSEGGVTKTAQ